VDQGRSSVAPWTHGGADKGHGGALTGAWPPAAPVRQSSPAGAQNGEGSEGNSARVSPELERRCGGRATVVPNGEAAALSERAAQAGRGEIGAGRGAVKLREGAHLLYGPEERRGGMAGAVNAGVNGFNAVEDGPT
jgi:hypothetical protein